MCAGAMVNSRIRRVIFGMRDPRCGAAGTALNVTGFPGMLHNVEVVPGLMEEECKGTGCLGLVHWDDPEGWNGEGGGRRIQDGSDGLSPARMPTPGSRRWA